MAALTGGRLRSPAPGPVAGRFVVDSRAVEPGDLFVALKGDRVDGHDYLNDAMSRGAAGCVVARDPEAPPSDVTILTVPDPLAALQQISRAHRAQCGARIIGITGSNGKTTTKEMLAHLLRSGGRRVHATRGNFNSQIGLPLMLLELNAKHSHGVFEMGASQAGDLSQLADLAKPDVAVLTNIGRAHLEFFGSIEGVLAAKWELVAALPKDGIAVLNADDALLMSRRGELTGSVITFGLSPRADVRAERLYQTPTAVFDLVVGQSRRTVKLPVGGLFNVSNALAAAAVALWERMPIDDVARALERFAPPPQRMQERRRPDGSVFLIDAYNANPDSMRASLESFSQSYAGSRRLAVLGGMRELGPQAEEEHRKLGRFVAGLNLDEIYFLGAEGEWFRAGAEEVTGGAPCRLFADPEALLAALRSDVTPTTVVLFKASRSVRMERVYDPLLVKFSS
jgi:UDP-N-acetylmuramoyl-tripeptide--D-alanyl-D-alanine ligase